MPVDPLRVCCRNRQRVQAVDGRFLRGVLRHYLGEIVAAPECDLCFHLVDAPEMTRVNRQFLNHEGSTDVITFDHQEDADSAALYGEIYICVADAVKQAHQFRCDWTAEVVRYAVHGVLHLCGYDDHSEAGYREMKQAENRSLRKLRREFSFARLERT